MKALFVSLALIATATVASAQKGGNRPQPTEPQA
jgi:hypothetical protein